MKANKKVLAAILAAMMTVSTAATMVSAAVTESTGPESSTAPSTVSGKWYTDTQNGTKYYFFLESNGNFAQGWRKIENKWFYFNGAEGAKITVQFPTSVGTVNREVAPAVVNAAITIEGKNYRFGSNGVMVTGWYYADGKDPAAPDEVTSGHWEYYSAQGQRQSNGWILDGGRWYYITANTGVDPSHEVKDSSGNVVTDPMKMLAGGKYTIDGVVYEFADNGMLKSDGIGWVQSGGIWYLKGDKGQNVTGFKEVNGKVYYMATADDVTANPDLKAGQMMVGWFNTKVDGKDTWFFAEGSGSIVTGWKKLAGQWYYFRGNGAAVEGWDFIDGRMYYFNTAKETDLTANDVCKMATGWRYVYKSNAELAKDGAKGWYHFDASGNMDAGKWIQTNGNWYYVKGNGAMIASSTTTPTLATVDGKIYAFRNNGIMVIGEVKIGDMTLVFGSNGALVSSNDGSGNEVAPTAPPAEAAPEAM